MTSFVVIKEDNYMEIPVLSRFIKGLRLFFSSKRLRWLTIVFLIGAVSILLFRELGRIFPQIGTGLLAIFGGF